MAGRGEQRTRARKEMLIMRRCQLCQAVQQDGERWLKFCGNCRTRCPWPGCQNIKTAAYCRRHQLESGRSVRKMTSSEVVIADVEWLLSCGESTDMIVQRVGRRLDSIYRTLRTAGRDDLADRLKADKLLRHELLRQRRTS